MEKLAANSDLLVSEMIDFDRTMAEVRRLSPNLPAPVLAGLQTHLRDHHLTPRQVGELARAAKVKAVVVTHISAPDLDGARTLEYLSGIAETYSGPAVIAQDLAEF
jgi:ribonuclease BN (tRNA processing enzyme)